MYKNFVIHLLEMSARRNPTANPAFPFPPILSDEVDLARQYGDINEEQRKLLEPFVFENDADSLAKVMVDLTPVGETPDRTKDVIFGADISDLLIKNCQGQILGDTINKAMKMTCHFVNETYGHDPPYCAAPDFPTWSYMAEDDMKEAIEYFENAGIRRATFHETKYIFIHVPDPTTADHSTLLVISPFHKTLEFLDSDSENRQTFRDNTLLKTIRFLSQFLKHDFRPLEWQLRYDSSAQQSDSRNDCTIAVAANTMAIAFGYDLPDWIGAQNLNPPAFPAHMAQEDYRYTVNGNPYVVRYRDFFAANKRKRLASELLHGKLEPFAGSDDNEDYPFVYQLGNRDYTAPQTQYRLEGDGTPRAYEASFRFLSHVPHIYRRLPRYMIR